MNWYLAVLKNYVGFSGRARRMEYWMFMIVNFFVYAGLLAIDRMMGHTAFEHPETSPNAKKRESIEVRTMAFF